MTCTAKQLVKRAKSQLGYKESPPNSNKTKYGKEFGVDGKPWCAIGVWWCFHKEKSDELYCGGKRVGGVPTVADYYIAHKQMVKKTKGRLGDLVMFDFNHNGTSDHIGIIEKKLGGGYYQTIEFNTGTGNDTNGGMVMRRKRHTSVISWIARPKYKKKPAKTPAKKKVDVSKYPTLRKGSRGKYVKLLQRKLSVQVDGIFGAKTEKAVKKFQKKKKIKADGIVGQKTWKCLF